MSLNEPDIQAEIAGTRRRRGLTSRGRWFLLGIAIAIVLGIGIVLSVAQTGWGRAQILAYTVRAAEGRLNGVLAVEGGLRGNLLTGARFYGVRLVDDQGAPLFVADSIFIRYRVATFLGGDIVINRLDVYAGDVDIFRLPGDTLWNYQRVLQDTTSAAAAGDPRAILIERVLVYDTHVTISAPVEGDPRFTPERRQRELERMLADTARYVLEELPGGYLQHNTVEIERAEVSELYIGGEERGGTYVELVDAVGEVRLWREPPL